MCKFTANIQYAMTFENLYKFYAYLLVFLAVVSSDVKVDESTGKQMLVCIYIHVIIALCSITDAQIIWYMGMYMILTLYT